ncbi:MAG: oxidoreductase, partial [Armatimonadota bacterium]
RKMHTRVFRPSLEEGQCKYIWLGTHWWLEAFTFIFRETEHGLFQVHAYPFDGTTSTFIVECTNDTWRAAGLDHASEDESIAFCERLFAPELGGRALMSNNSKWISFLTLKNAKWRHRNIVLLGDAAHTAHFSIGSGTKLAMEDSIALAQAFEQHRDLEGAFNEYEQGRRPAVEAFQQAAEESQTYFESLQRYLHFEPMQFAFHLLTRSGRISYDSLRLRDPQFVETVDRWFAAKTSAANRALPGSAVTQPPSIVSPPPLLTPLILRDTPLANRIVLTTRFAGPARNGRLTDEHRSQFADLARRGAGMIITEPVAVSSQGCITPASPGLYDVAHGSAWAQTVAAVHASSATKIALQLNHAGRRGATRPREEGLDRPLREGNWPLVSASPLPYTRQSQVPKEMDREDLEAVRDAFSRAARLACEAGFDTLMVHCAHGYLLASFISPLTNTRTDDYGGSLSGRMRFPLEVIDAVRAVWPEDRPLAVSLTADDCAAGGITIDDAIAAARMLTAHGADILHVLAGQTVPDASPAYGRGFLTALCDRVRNEAGVLTIASGFLVTTDEINSILAAGRADLCVMDPPHLDAWPAFGTDEQPEHEQQAQDSRFAQGKEAPVGSRSWGSR